MTPDHTIHPLDDLAVYALDALDDRERAVVDAHLEDCAACRAELDQHLATLSHLTAPDAPPPELWDRIARQTATRPDQATDVVPFDLGLDRPNPDPDADAGPSPGPGPGPSDEDPGPRHRARHLARTEGRDGFHRPDRRAGRSPRRVAGRPMSRGTWLAVAAALVIVVGVAVWSLRPSDAPTNVAELAAAAADDPDATVIDLASDDGEARARVVTTPAATAYVLLDDLPRLPSDRAYQLWRLDDPDAPVSLGVLGDGSTRAAAVSIPPGTAAFALSDEPAPGSIAPTGPIVATGRQA